MKPLLADLTLKALKPEDAGKNLKDGGALFGVVRVSKGKVSVRFFWRYRRDGTPYNFGCGTWPTTSLKAVRCARDEARDLHAKGIDPADARRAQVLAERAAQKAKIAHHEHQLARPTVRDLFDRWSAMELSSRKDQGAETKRGLEKDVLSALGERYADDITRADVMTILDQVKARGALRLANRLFAEMRQMFGFATVRQIVTANPTANIARKHVGGTTSERDRTLSADELRALPAALEGAGLLDSTKHAIWLMLATSARVGEVAKAAKADIDLDAATWRIPPANAKNGKPHVIHLSEFALLHMRALLDMSASKTWLLPATRGDKHRHVDEKSITKQISDRQLAFYERAAHAKRTTKHENALVLGDEKWTPHDLRRTAATVMQALGVLPEVIERTLNHVEENRVKRTYQTFDYAPQMREAWRLLGDRLDLLTRADAVNVVMLPQAASAS